MTLFLLIDSLIHGLVGDVKATLIGFEAPLFLEVPAQKVDLAKEALASFSQKNKKWHLLFFESHEFDGLVMGSGGTFTGAKVRSVTQDFFTIHPVESAFGSPALRGFHGVKTFNVIWFDGFDERQFVNSTDQILLGESLYTRLNVMPGDEETIMLTHPFAELGPSGEVEPAERLLKIAGVFLTGRTDFDDVYALIPNGTLTGMADEGLLETVFFIFTPNVDDVFAIKEAWQTAVPDSDLLLTSWFDRNAQAFKAIRLERLMYTFIFILVTLISCFNLAGVVAIFSLGKARDAGILKSLGLSSCNVKKIFVSLGFILGGVGGLLGVFFGVVLTLILTWSHLTLPAAYGFSRLPLAINPLTVILLIIGSPVVSALMAYVPSARFTRVSVTEVLKS